MALELLVVVGQALVRERVHVDARGLAADAGVALVDELPLLQVLVPAREVVGLEVLDERRVEELQRRVRLLRVPHGVEAAHDALEVHAHDVERGALRVLARHDVAPVDERELLVQVADLRLQLLGISS